MILVYLQCAICMFLQYDNMIVHDKTEGWSALCAIIFTILVIVGLPFIHLITLFKRSMLNIGVARQYPEYHKIPKPKKEKKNLNDLLEQA